MSRLPPVPRENLPPNQQQAHDSLHDIASQAFGSAFTWQRKDGALVGPFPAFVAAPEAGVAMLQYLGKLSAIPGLPAAAKETAILSTGAHFRAAYELYAHSHVAEQTTELSREQIDKICRGEKPAGLDKVCDVAYDVAKYLSGTPGPLPQALWDRAVKGLGREGTVALVHYVGMYAYTCIILNAMDAPLPEEGE